MAEIAERLPIIFGILTVGALAATWIIVAITRRRVSDLRHYEKFAAQFYTNTSPLMSDDETPEEVLELFSFINEKIVDPHAAREFFTLASEGRFAVFGTKSPAGLIKAREFFARRPELEESFLQSIANGFIAMTFLSPYYGRKARLLFTSLDSPLSRERAAIVYHDSKKHDHNGDDCLAAA